jgi:hypothetical protein
MEVDLHAKNYGDFFFDDTAANSKNDRDHKNRLIVVFECHVQNEFKKLIPIKCAFWVFYDSKRI